MCRPLKPLGGEDTCAYAPVAWLANARSGLLRALCNAHAMTVARV